MPFAYSQFFPPRHSTPTTAAPTSDHAVQANGTTERACYLFAALPYYGKALQNASMTSDPAPPEHPVDSETSLAMKEPELAVRIWVDADAAPLDVKQVVFRAAKRLQLETILVANQKISTPLDTPTARCVVVREGADQADRYIVKHANLGDLAITADLPLAGDLVAKGVLTIDPRGDEYNPDNIAGRLSVRNFMDTLRGTGMEVGGSPPYSASDKKAFASTFDRLLTKAIRNRAKKTQPK